MVGYWPSFVIPTLAHGAEEATFGGEIENKAGEKWHHTKTEMGNGHFGTNKEGRASQINNIKTIKHAGGSFSNIDEYEIDMNKPNCYNAMVSQFHPSTDGLNIYYGGPGYRRDNYCS